MVQPRVSVVRRVALITCGGTFNAETGHYEENLVVFDDLIGTAL